MRIVNEREKLIYDLEVLKNQLNAKNFVEHRVTEQLQVLIEALKVKT